MVTTSQGDHNDGVVHRPQAASSYLTQLGLDADEQAALARQGGITRELRGRRTAVYKLRFRLGGRQRVRYLGTDVGRVEQVQLALSELQGDRRAEQAMDQLRREAAQLLRDSERQLEPLLEERGYHFHGRSIRRQRKTAE